MKVKKTNLQMLQELLEVYHPKEPWFVNGEEARVIREKLELDERDVAGLRNARNDVITFFSDEARRGDWDRMSAITYIIDSVIVDKGGEV